MNPTVLIVDDSAEFRQLARHLIHTQWPAAPVDDWDPVAQGQPHVVNDLRKYDVVLLDYMLGKENGLKWLEELKRDPTCPPIVFLTGHGSEDVAVQAIKLGASDYVRKHDLSMQRLTRAIAESTERKRKQLSEAEAEAEAMAELLYTKISGAPRINIQGYQILKKIGEGGMSSVFLAERASDKQNIVLKVLDADLSKNLEFLRRFIREYGLISKVRSPHVVTIFDQGVSHGHMFIAMEYFPGGDLKAKIDTGMQPKQALNALLQLARGLGAVHAAGIVHRDMKPQNIMFRANDSLGILDFGIAKQMLEETQLTAHGQVFGTPYYMSPEQGSGKPVDARSDLYSAGVILFEMLTGRRMYTADNAVSLVIKHMNDEIPTLPRLIAQYQKLLDRLAAKRPEDRFQSATEVIQFLNSEYGMA